MELPHNTFWKEARPNMPELMKKRFVQAFEKIHKRGVVHGNIRLRHMLIGADGRVTITNFKTARSLFPLGNVGVRACVPAELALELRMVKYILDYEGAQKREHAKLKRVLQIENLNSKREQLIAAKRDRLHDDPIPEEKMLSEEDIMEPPLDFRGYPS